jgi:V/A-type H+-transporting ATPase subunit K
MNMRVSKLLLAAIPLGAALAVAATIALLALPTAAAGEAPAAIDPSVARWAFVAAAVASAAAAAAAGYAVAQVGSAAVGAVAEKPELFGRMLILVGLAEGIAIYGLIVAVLIFNRVG